MESHEEQNGSAPGETVLHRLPPTERLQPQSLLELRNGMGLADDGVAERDTDVRSHVLVLRKKAEMRAARVALKRRIQERKVVLAEQTDYGAEEVPDYGAEDALATIDALERDQQLHARRASLRDALCKTEAERLQAAELDAADEADGRRLAAEVQDSDQVVDDLEQRADLGFDGGMSAVLDEVERCYAGEAAGSGGGRVRVKRPEREAAQLRAVRKRNAAADRVVLETLDLRQQTAGDPQYRDAVAGQIAATAGLQTTLSSSSSASDAGDESNSGSPGNTDSNDDAAQSGVDEARFTSSAAHLGLGPGVNSRRAREAKGYRAPVDVQGAGTRSRPTVLRLVLPQHVFDNRNGEEDFGTWLGLHRYIDRGRFGGDVFAARAAAVKAAVVAPEVGSTGAGGKGGANDEQEQEKPACVGNVHLAIGNDSELVEGTHNGAPTARDWRLDLEDEYEVPGWEDREKERQRQEHFVKRSSTHGATTANQKRDVDLRAPPAVDEHAEAEARPLVKAKAKAVWRPKKVDCVSQNS